MAVGTVRIPEIPPPEGVDPIDWNTIVGTVIMYETSNIPIGDVYRKISALYRGFSMSYYVDKGDMLAQPLWDAIVDGKHVTVYYHYGWKYGLEPLKTEFGGKESKVVYHIFKYKGRPTGIIIRIDYSDPENPIVRIAT